MTYVKINGHNVTHVTDFSEGRSVWSFIDEQHPAEILRVSPTPDVQPVEKQSIKT